MPRCLVFQKKLRAGPRAIPDCGNYSRRLSSSRPVPPLLPLSLSFARSRPLATRSSLPRSVPAGKLCARSFVRNSVGGRDATCVQLNLVKMRARGGTQRGLVVNLSQGVEVKSSDLSRAPRYRAALQQRRRAPLVTLCLTSHTQ